MLRPKFVMSTAASTSSSTHPTTVPVIVVSADDYEVPLSDLKRFTVAEYHAMIDAGVFAEGENYELLEGLIVRKMTKHPPHWIACGSLRDALIALRLPGFFVHSQDPVTTSDSEP